MIATISTGAFLFYGVMTIVGLLLTYAFVRLVVLAACRSWFDVFSKNKKKEIVDE